MFGYPLADRPGNVYNEFVDFNGGKIYVTSAEEAGHAIDCVIKYQSIEDSL